MIDGMRKHVAPAIAARGEKEWRTLSDLERAFELTFCVNTPKTVFVSTARTSHKADTTYVRCKIQLGYEDLPLERHLLGKIGVTTAVDVKAEGGPVTLTIAQEAGGRLPPPTISRSGEPDDEPSIA